jgi:hypothetical protein
MSQSEKIQIKLVDLEKQRIKKVTESVLILHENCIEYILNFDADEPQTDDDELMKDEGQWKLIHNNFHISAAKDCVAGIEKSYQTTPKLWKISIAVNGFSQDIKCYFKEEADAEALRQRMHDYLFDDLKIDYATSSNGRRTN